MVRDGVAEVRERTDIVELVSTYVPDLKRTGRSYKGLCPFHQEKTPSFIVFPDSQNFHCFGCGKGGDVFTFYMGVEQTDFREALHELARRSGIELASVPSVAPEVDAHRQRLIDLNELAVTFYRHVLRSSPHGEPGRTVVTNRSLSDQMVDLFQLGYAPDRWDGLLTYLQKRDIDLAVAAEAGLLQERDSGGYYDRFRKRLMFPIRNRDGRVVGFGGRIVGDGQPKYLNSPQTPVFDKSNLLYGLDLAKDEIRQQDQVVIVEGYMDAIAAHQFGHRNVVAAMGTALTEAQVAQVKRSSKRIVLALDADTAGQMATLRGLDTMREALDHDSVPIPDAFGVIRFERKLKTEIAIVELPDGKDPDELIRRDPERWPEIVASAKPFLDFTLDAVAGAVAADDARGKADAVARLAPILQQVPDRVVQSHYISRLARRLGLEERLVQSEIRRSRLRTLPAAEQAPSRPIRASTEDHLLALLLRHRELTGDIMNLVPAEDLMDTRNRELLGILRDEALRELDAIQLVAGLDDALADHAERLLAMLDGRPEQFPGQVQREARQALDNLGRERFSFLMRQLDAGVQTAQQANDEAALAELRTQIGILADRHRQYYPPPSPYFRDSRSSQVAR